MRNLRIGCAIAALMAMPMSALHAQETSATLRGSITNDSGAAIANATVTVVHTPSGTRNVLTTSADGGFNATGLRLGGPFEVTVAATGFDTATATVENLNAGQPQRVEVVLFAAGQAIVVTGTRGLKSSITLASGPATTLDVNQIAGVATINRDIRDLARRDPFVTLDSTNSRAISIAGQNNRFNRVTVDGVLFGDPFGLNNGGLASARGPVPIDAICQFSVEIAPSDIQQGGFQGGAINTQLCSGSNNFHGKGFFTYSDDSLAGKNTRGTVVSRTFDSKNYGASVSGPIIQDRLFFALTYEGLRNSTPTLVGIIGEGFANSIPNLTRAQVDQIRGLATSVYAYDALDVAKAVPEKDDKIVGKFDLNIADGHRAALTYVFNKGTSLSGNTPAGTLASNNPTLSLQSNNYEAAERNHYGVLQFNDTWSDEFSTQARFSYNDYLRGQVPFNGRTFGQFTVCLDPVSAGSLTTCTLGTPQIAFGPDNSRQANELRVKSNAVELQAQIKVGDHAVKIIAERRQQDINNLFQQNVSGVFYFDSVADFTARKANTLNLAVPINGDINSGAAIFKNINYTFGVQDVWNVNSDLTAYYGFRYDLYDTNATPAFNQNFFNRYGFANNATLKGRGIFQPRLGFDFTPGDRLRLKGTAGIYAGGSPNVWVGNSYANTGVAIASVNAQRTATGFNSAVQPFGGFTALQIGNFGLSNVSGGQGIPSVYTQYVAQGNVTLAQTNAIDPNFKVPSQWRFSLSADYKLDLGRFGDGWRLGGDLVYSRVENGLAWTDVRSVANGTLPDGRKRYRELANTAGAGGTSVQSNTADVLLYNTKQGYSWNAVARLRKEWDNGISASASYLFQRSFDVNSGTSSVANSNYTQTAASDPNFSAYGTSNYQIDDSYKLGLGYSHKFFGDSETRIDAFFESRAGQHFSYTFQDTTSGRSAVFGTTGTNNRYLVYVPNVASATADPLVTYATAADFTNLQTLVQNGVLNKYQGQIAPKNVARAPRFNKLDLHVSQEIGLAYGFKIEVFGDMENVLNFIDKDWGSLRQVAFPYYGQIANVACNNGNSLNTACTVYTYSNVRTPAQTFDNVSLWQVRFGARVKF